VTPDHREHLLDDHRREAEAELVDEQPPRAAGQGAGEGEHLLLSPGQQRAERPNDPGENAQRRRLAGAVRPGQRDDLTGRTAKHRLRITGAPS
jgi:hypothetical protein